LVNKISLAQKRRLSAIRVFATQSIQIKNKYKKQTIKKLKS